jgi:hypothetical protein
LTPFFTNAAQWTRRSFALRRARHSGFDWTRANRTTVSMPFGYRRRLFPWGWSDSRHAAAFRAPKPVKAARLKCSTQGLGFGLSTREEAKSGPTSKATLELGAAGERSGDEERALLAWRA